MTPVLSTSDLSGFLARHEPVAKPKLLAVGAKAGAWRVTAFLGRGGNAEVYRVTGPSVAALKVLTKDDAASRARFAQEARLLAAGISPSLPRLIASGDIDGRPYLVTELLEPVDLPTSDAGVADYMLAVCAAVCALHRTGLIHRDIKPSNVMRRANGELVLIDLGLVKDRRRSGGPEPDVSVVSGRVVAVGTPRFAAPEQMAGGEVTEAADIHALGCLADAAFGSKPPRTWLPIIRRATSSIPGRRYATVTDLMRAIRRRKRPRLFAAFAVSLGMALATLALVRFRTPTFPAPSSDDGTGEESFDLTSLATPFATNLVTRQLVWERWVTNRFGNAEHVVPERAYRLVTNHVSALRIDLHGRTNAFARPVVLYPERPYFITGPGMLSADFRAGGSNAVVHLRNCFFFNRSTIPMDKAGIRYVFEGGAYLNFTELDEPPRTQVDAVVEGFDGAFDVIRFHGPETPEALEREREADSYERLRRER